MDYNKTNIAIIGRGINQNKWNAIYEVLDENSDDVSYSKFEITDASWFKGVEAGDFHAYIYLATVPKYTNLPYIKLPANATEDDIMAGMEDLVSKLFGDSEEEKDDELVDTDIPKASSDLIELLNKPLVCTELDDLDIPRSTSNVPNRLDRLVGVQIKVHDKEVILDKDDAYKLTELMAFAKQAGYEVTDVIVE